MAFSAPVNDITYCLKHIVGIDKLIGSTAYPDFDEDVMTAILEEGGKFAQNILASTNRKLDSDGVKLDENRNVITPDYVKEISAKYNEAMWVGLKFPTEIGGMGLPNTLGLAVSEMMHASNMAFGLKPMLTTGTILAISKHGTPEQIEEYIGNLISGEWSGTMNLTEPGAGSDVGALVTRAERLNDGRYKIYGQKIFITWGDNDLHSNIVHLVLARLNDAPPGVRGISLFIVPKFLKDENGEYTIRNDCGPIGLEHKLGIHGSPTCVMAYGDGLFGNETGAIGYLLGEENQGLKCMFTMMNEARLDVGLQGVAIAEAATQHAISYAKERKQGKAIGEKEASSQIIKHPDVKRMLLEMIVRTKMVRAICYQTAFAADMSNICEGDEARFWHARESLLTPIAKAYSSDTGFEVASIGVQVHGGMGFIEETGAAQYLRDARIAQIYEGTNAIQANDLIGRKLSGDGGKALFALLHEIKEFSAGCADDAHSVIARVSNDIVQASNIVEACAKKLIDWQNSTKMNEALSNACAFLEMCGALIGTHYLLTGIVNSKDFNANSLAQLDFARTKILPIIKSIAENFDDRPASILQYDFDN